MRIGHAALAVAAALSLAACESQADKAAEQKADAVEAQAERAADALEAQADAMDRAGDVAAAGALERKADEIEEAGDREADAIERQAGKQN